MTDTNTTPAAVPANTLRVCTLHVVGIAARCRKVDRHYVKLGEHPVDVDVAVIEKLAREKLAGFKQVQRATLNLNFAERNGMVITLLLCDPRSIAVNLT